MPPPIVLSKTKLMSYLQCPRKLWLEQYSPELEDEDAIDFAAIETGRVVGAKAREVYVSDTSHRIPNERGLRAAVAATAELMQSPNDGTVFEATFDHDGLTVQVDVLKRTGGATRLVEVKAATRVKEHYLHDCAIQAWTMTQSGHAPDAVAVAHVNNEFVYRGDGDYSNLFVEVDLTEDIAALTPGIEQIVTAARATLAELDEPAADIGEHCRTPYACPFFEHCAPPQGEYPVTALGGNKDRLYALMREGFTDVRDVPADRLANEREQRIQQQTQQGRAHVGEELAEFIAALATPRYYLDFETISFAIPIWSGTRPYEQLPFQWSCHIEHADGRVDHVEFLDLSGDAPMRACADALIDALGDTGPVLVYTSYEKTVISELATRFADLEGPLSAILDRLVDLYPVTKAHYYHPDMRGSWSIKAVLPTVAPELDYSALDEVHDGQEAQTAYLEAIKPDTSDSRREELRRALSAYCGFDTLAMMKLTEFFAA